jgi:hypothetical protein
LYVCTCSTSTSQRKLRGLDGKAEAAGAAARLTLGEGKAVAREEAITLPLGADLGHYAHLGDLFPFALGGPELSEGGASGRSQQVKREGRRAGLQEE